MDSAITAANGPAIPPRRHFRNTSTSSVTSRTRSRQLSLSSGVKSSSAEAAALYPAVSTTPAGASTVNPSIPSPTLFIHQRHTTTQSTTNTTSTTLIPPSTRQLPERTFSTSQRSRISTDIASPTSPNLGSGRASGHAASNSVGSIKDSIALAIRSWTRGDSYEGEKGVTSPATATPGRRHSRVASLSRRLSIGGAQSLLNINGNTKDAHQFHPLPLDTSPKKSKSHHRNSKSLSSLIVRGPSPPPQPAFDSRLNSRIPSSQTTSLAPPQNTNTLSAPSAQSRDSNSPSPNRRRHSRQPSASHSLRKISQANDSVEKLHQRRSSILAVTLPIQIPDPVSSQPDVVAVKEDKREKKARSSRRDKEGEAREERRARKMEAAEEDGLARRRQEKEKKAMLSKALQKAHAAVVLDNEQSFEGAIDAYSEACDLLQQVLMRSTAEEDQAKLDAIRSTYENRIFELQQMNPELGMPRQMLSSETLNGQSMRAVAQSQDAGQFGYSASISTPAQSHTVGVSDPPPFYPQQSQQIDSRAQARPHEHPENRLPAQRPSDPTTLPISRHIGNEELRKTSAQSSETVIHSGPHANKEGHSREDSTGAMSWLDTIDESGQSSVASSLHERDEDGLHRRRLRAASGGTEAEFNAAMDAAVEAAYGGELEPYDDGARRISAQIKSAKANVHLAKERVKEVEREEAILAARRRTQQMRTDGVYEPPRDSLDEEGEEEERMLEEMTKELMGEEYNFGLSEKSGAVPRQSDSSEFSGSSAWHSSTSSSRTTAATTLSAAADDLTGKSGSGLPRLEEEGRPSQEFSNSPERSRDRASLRTGEDIRSRRLSGQPSKQLTIETAPSMSNAQSQARQAPPLRTDAASLAPPHSGQSDPRSAVQHSAASSHAPSYFSHQGLSPHPIISPGSTMTISPATPGMALERSFTNTSQTSQGTAHRVLSRKNKSNVSLNGAKMSRTFSASSPDESEPSTTPLSQHFYGLGSNGSGYGLTPGTDQVPALPAFPPDLLSMMQTDGSEASKLFFSSNEDVQSPDSPDGTSNAPVPLEPCPESYLLRPFWLMRAVFQTLAHPRGGYISTKLFVPRDVWRVKGVKIKGVDDKIATCDLLTEALRRLGAVDTLDADAVLDEMQRLENILEQAQITLTKKLGSEVGVHTIQSLFKDAPASMNTGSETLLPGSVLATHSSMPATRSTSQSKGYLSSWRKLRSKSSAVGLASSTNSHSSTTGAGHLTGGANGALSVKDIQNKKSSLTMATLPMTSLTSIRFAKRDLDFLSTNDGPHAAYVACLARLCDAVQIIDQIARQVEDPGLKFSSSSYVGLELCTRHAAEFFGFYVCRFILSDLGMLLDKFIKRGSEWVLV